MGYKDERKDRNKKNKKYEDSEMGKKKRKGEK